MSCFIVKAETIGAIATYIFDTPWAKQHMMQYTGLSMPSMGGEYARCLVDLAFAIHTLNHAAFKQRYGEYPLEPSYKVFPFVTKAPIHVLKALACFLYQCTEGTVPDCALYKALATLRNKLAQRIVYDTPEYIEAPWE